MAKVRKRRRRFDPMELGHLGRVLRAGHVAVTLLNLEGEHRGVSGAAIRAHTAMYSVACEFPFRAHFQLPRDWCLLGYAHHVQHGSWVQGQSLEKDAVVVVMPGQVCEMMFRAGSCLSGLLLPVHSLQDGFVQEIHRNSRPSRLLPVAQYPHISARIKSSFECLRRYFIDQDSSADIRSVDDQIRACLDADIASLECESVLAQTRRAHFQVFQRVEKYMIEEIRHELHARDLCEVANTSQRNLRYIFDEFLGISPNRYLLMLRLCQARRRLVASDARRHSVRSIALECGLWNLSRFSTHYRQAFGELPSKTLHAPDEEFPKTYIRGMTGGVEWC